MQTLSQIITNYSDYTPDVSHVEELTMIICFADVIKTGHEIYEPEVNIRECLGFVRTVGICENY